MRKKASEHRWMAVFMAAQTTFAAYSVAQIGGGGYLVGALGLLALGFLALWYMEGRRVGSR